MAETLSPEDRELNLVLKLELRIGNADTDEKLQKLLQTFLAPLILKLASEHVSVRNKVISTCQYVSRRLKSSPAIALPVAALLKQFRESTHPFVRQFDLLYLQQGLTRLSLKDGTSLLPEILQVGTPSSSFGLQSSDGKSWSVTLQFLLRLLRSWTIPDRLSPEAVDLKVKLSLMNEQMDMLAYWLTRFLLYDGNKPPVTSIAPSTALPVQAKSAVLPVEEANFFSTLELTVDGQLSPAILQSIKPQVAKFLFLPTFSDQQRFLAAVILTSDPSNLECYKVGDLMFKQCNFDLETLGSVNDLMWADLIPKPRIQIRILSLLSKSREAAQNVPWMFNLLESQFRRLDNGLEASKLRSSILTFVEWTARLGPRDDLAKISDQVWNTMRDVIVEQGWPNPQTTMTPGSVLNHAQVDMRKHAFSVMGTFTAHAQITVEFLEFLFTSFRCDLSHPDVHEAIKDALNRAVNHFQTSAMSLYQIKSLLLTNMTASIGMVDSNGYTTVHSARLAAIKCTNACLPFSDVDARYLDLLATEAVPGQSRDVSEVQEEGRRGLDLYLHQSRQRGDRDTLVDGDLPDMNQLIRRCFDNTLAGAQSVPGEMRPLTGSAIQFCRNVLALQASVHACITFKIGPEWQGHLDAMISNKQDMRTAIATELSKLDDNAASALLHAAGLAVGLDRDRISTAAAQLFENAPDSLLLSLLGASSISSETNVLYNLKKSNSILAARCYGKVASLAQFEDARQGQNVIFSDLQDWQHTTGALSLVLEAELVRTTFTITRRWMRGNVDLEERFRSAMETIIDVILESRDQSLIKTGFLCLVQICLTSPFDLGKDLRRSNANKISLLDRIVEVAKKENEMAVTVLGRIIRYQSLHHEEEWVTAALEKLFSFHEIRNAELQFAVGETLAVSAMGWKSSSLLAEFDVEGSIPEQATDEKMLTEILDKCMYGCKSTKPSLRKASAIWLLSTVQYGGTERLVTTRLRESQAVFMRLLSDKDEIVQETGSRGLSLVYEMGDKPMREDLVRDLVQSFTGNTSRLGGSVDEETELFEPGTLPTEGGASVTTYKDIVSLANEVGDPSLVYRFMNMASSNAIWSSRAAFGRFGLSSILADSDYLSTNKKFYPKLFRYRFDPNPNVRRAMNDIWKSLVKNPNIVVSENFNLIIEDLLKSILGKEWRVREASCAAIADLVQDREVELYEKYLDDIWNTAFKVVDDIKESVRVAALTLCRTLVNILIRNLETGDGMSSRAKVMLDHALQFLIQQFSTGGSQEVQTYAVANLLEIVSKCPSKALRPHAPLLLQNLVLSLSSLEPESVNYLHLNADKYGLTTEKLDGMRVSGLNASPVTQSIERCLEALDDVKSEGGADEILNDAMKRLETTFKESIGLPSKVGLARVMVTLVVRHQHSFRPFADRFALLTRKSLIDRNETISVSFATALAYLMRIVSEKQIRIIAKYVKELYFDSDLESSRALVGELLQAFSKVSNDTLKRYVTMFVPLIFVGQSDIVQTVQESFITTWKDNFGGSRSVSLYLPEIIELLSANIKSNRYSTRHTCCLAVASLITSLDANDQLSQNQAGLLWPVIQEALTGKTWEGKEKIILAYPKFVKIAQCLRTDQQYEQESRKIALREARRTNAQYRPHAITALADFVKVRSDLDFASEVLPLLSNVVDEIIADDADKMDLDVKDEASVKHATRGNRSLASDTLSSTSPSERLNNDSLEACVRCLFVSISASTSKDILDYGSSIVEQTRKNGSRKIRLALYEGAKSLVEVSSDGSRRRNEVDTPEVLQQNDRKGDVEVFTAKTGLALLEDVAPASYDQESENLRQARITLALALVQGSNVVADHLPHVLVGDILSSWLNVERSRPLRLEIECLILAWQTLGAGDRRR